MYYLNDIIKFFKLLKYIMDTLNSKQRELLEEIVKPEKEGYIELYDSEGDKPWLLNDLIREGKKEIIKKLILLKKLIYLMIK